MSILFTERLTTWLEHLKIANILTAENRKAGFSN